MSQRSRVFAHRGAKRVAPEDTLPAFAKAIELGADGIELDVQCSQDGVLVVMHNFTVDETTNGTGRVGSLPASQLTKLDAGSHFSSAFAGTPVPTLEEVLALVNKRVVLNIEVKSDNMMGGREVEPLVALIQAGDLYEHVIVSSFNPITLLKLRHTDPRVKLGLLYYGQHIPPFLRDLCFRSIMHPEALHPHYHLIDADYMAWAKTIPAQVNTWTVNDPDEARRLSALGVDTIITDVPDLILDTLG